MAVRKKAAKKKTTERRVASKRELIDTGTNKLFARRNPRGTSLKKGGDVRRGAVKRAAARKKHG